MHYRNTILIFSMIYSKPLLYLVMEKEKSSLTGAKKRVLCLHGWNSNQEVTQYQLKGLLSITHDIVHYHQFNAPFQTHRQVSPFHSSQIQCFWLASQVPSSLGSGIPIPSGQALQVQRPLPKFGMKTVFSMGFLGFQTEKPCVRYSSIGSPKVSSK